VILVDLIVSGVILGLCHGCERIVLAKGAVLCFLRCGHMWNKGMQQYQSYC